MRRPPPLAPGAKAWTPAEDAVLRARYEREGAAAMARALGRTLTSIHHRTRALGLYTHRRWTAKDDAQLEMLWGDLGLTALAKVVGRRPLAVYWRAGVLGLRRGVPEGMESVRAAARRTGYDAVTLDRILAAGGVVPRRTMSRPIGRADYRFRFVEPTDVDDAVAAWLACEDVEPAARARGLSGETLARWLVDSGLTMPARPGGRRRWRVPTETIDAVVRERRGRESISAAARRVGVCRTALRQRLMALGHVPPRACATWWIEPSVVDAVARAA